MRALAECSLDTAQTGGRALANRVAPTVPCARQNRRRPATGQRDATAPGGDAPLTAPRHPHTALGTILVPAGATLSGAATLLYPSVAAAASSLQTSSQGSPAPSGGLPLLSLLIFLPLLGAVIIGVMPAAQKVRIRTVATVFSAIPLALVVWLLAAYGYSRAGLQFVQRVDWIPAWHVQYFLGVDGLSLAMLALSAGIGLIAAIASYGIEERVKEYFIWFLTMLTGTLGVFCAQDLILFVFFFDIVLVPMYFLIAIWGGPRREYAAVKFLIYTFTGSVLMLVAILAAFFLTGAQTFSIPDLASLIPQDIGRDAQLWLFVTIFLGFAIKLPMVPLHTWLPDAHVEAPTPISVLLAAVLLKIGGYGLLRIALPLFPTAAHVLAPAVAALGVINLLYAALAALAQHDFKKLVAYSSVSHMGFVLLGVALGTPIGIDGAIFVMVSHGLISAMLFLMVGVFYDRTHTRELGRLGGMYATLPLAGTILGFAALANLGLPALSGFVGEFFTLAGVFGTFRVIAFWAALGLVLVAGFNLVLMKRVVMGPTRPEWQGLPPVKPRELVTLLPLMAGVILFGVAPALLLNLINTPAAQIAARLGGG